MQPISRLAVLGAAVIISLTASPPAPAEPLAAASSFGQHVRTCAQQVGFSGEHNPGMHQGLSGWDGMPCETAL
jgi:hypothetical protein